VWQLLAVDLGRAGYAALTRFAAPVVVGALAFDLYRPRRPATYALFAVSVALATVTLTFWWVDSGEFVSSFTNGGREFTSYPSNVYSGAVRRVFAYALGFAFVAYYPALALQGRPDPLGGPAWLG